ncbi:unnamed protein product [Peniophora sp. CBMAI 1063]|nr:unnamed protein product [Peniophora sp. CBMAI 1063]
MSKLDDERPAKRAKVEEDSADGSATLPDLQGGSSLQCSTHAIGPPDPSKNIMSVIDIVLVIISYVKDIHGLDGILSSRAFNSLEAERARAWTTVQSILDLRLVNRVWSEAILLSRSSWAVIPATLTHQKSFLRRCIRLSGKAPLALTFSELPDPEIWELLDTEKGRLHSLRLACDTPAHFFAHTDSPDAHSHWSTLAAVRALEIRAGSFAMPSRAWMEPPTPRLDILHLTNFVFAASCVLPKALRELTLHFSDLTILRESMLEDRMTFSDLSGVLAGLSALERLKLDIRYMLDDGSSNEGHADLSSLKQLSVRSRSPRDFNAVISHITCPPLERAHLIVDLPSADVGEVADDLTAASRKLSALLPTSQAGDVDVIELGHIYVDERGHPIGPPDYWRRCQCTVAAAARERALPLTDDTLSTTSIASTAAFALTVTRPALDELYRDPSLVLRLILAGLPSTDLDSLTVYCRPGLAVEPDDGEEAGSNESVLAYADMSIFERLFSARRVNWLGNGHQLANLLRQAGSFPSLNYLPHDIPPNAEYNIRLEKAIELRQEKARQAVDVQGFLKPHARRMRRLAWRAPRLLPETVANIAQMFDTLLETVGERVI